eukprot:761819-Hanusia_phi.AAC.1
MDMPSASSAKYTWFDPNPPCPARLIVLSLTYPVSSCLSYNLLPSRTLPSAHVSVCPPFAPIKAASSTSSSASSEAHLPTGVRYGQYQPGPAHHEAQPGPPARTGRRPA